MYITLSPTVSQVNAMTDSIQVVVQSFKKMNEKATTKKTVAGEEQDKEEVQSVVGKEEFMELKTGEKRHMTHSGTRVKWDCTQRDVAHKA